ncbi:N-acetyltransferase HPA3 [Thalassobium sp. R2A62]|nr:N-acetyltransferase HPA3 [Thalassobium sp. R2A62]
MTKAKMPVDIRPIRAEDRSAWYELWTAYLEFYETTVSSDVYDKTFERLLGDDDRDFAGFLAWVDGKPVGLVHFLTHRHCWKIEDVIYLQDLYADPSVRGAGVGHALIEAVYSAGDSAGTPTVYWLTQDFNAQARKLYDRVANLTPFVTYQRAAA